MTVFIGTTLTERTKIKAKRESLSPPSRTPAGDERWRITLDDVIYIVYTWQMLREQYSRARCSFGEFFHKGQLYMIWEQ